MQYVLDSIGNRDGLQHLGLMDITNLSYPAGVEPTTSFIITYNAINSTTEPLNAYGVLWDVSLNQQVPNSYWEATVLAGESLAIMVSFPDGIPGNFNGEVQVGHFETGCTPEGATSCINGYTNDCTGGIWIPTTQTCGTPPALAGGAALLIGMAIILLIGTRRKETK